MTRDRRLVGGVRGLFFVGVCDFALGGGGIYWGLLKECMPLVYLAGGGGGGTTFCFVLVDIAWGVLDFLV